MKLPKTCIAVTYVNVFSGGLDESSDSFFLVLLSAWNVEAENKCDPLAPSNGQDVSETFKGKIEGEVKGLVSRLAGGSADINGEYNKLITDKLKYYPQADKIYVWQRIVYLACVSPDTKIDLNRLLEHI